MLTEDEVILRRHVECQHGRSTEGMPYEEVERMHAIEHDRDEGGGGGGVEKPESNRVVLAELQVVMWVNADYDEETAQQAQTFVMERLRQSVKQIEGEFGGEVTLGVVQ